MLCPCGSLPQNIAGYFAAASRRPLVFRAHLLQLRKAFLASWKSPREHACKRQIGRRLSPYLSCGPCDICLFGFTQHSQAFFFPGCKMAPVSFLLLAGWSSDPPFLTKRLPLHVDPCSPSLTQVLMAMMSVMHMRDSSRHLPWTAL